MMTQAQVRRSTNLNSLEGCRRGLGRGRGPGGPPGGRSHVMVAAVLQPVITQ
jgi:hypothetical protein